MLKRGIFIFVLVAMFGFHCKSQEISHQVLVPMASIAEQPGYNVSQTIGEVVVMTIASDNYELTQGFHQPGIKIDGPVPPQGSGVDVYPNPAIDFLQIELFGSEPSNFEVIIFGISGSVYYRKNFPCPADFWRIESIDISDYMRGMYFVRIRTSDGRILRLFKIEKM